LEGTDGVILLGHVRNVHERQLILAPDLKETLAAVDQFEIDALKKIDDYIRRVGLAAPTENIPRLLDGYREEEVTELSLQGVGISTVVWATGYAFDLDAPLATHTACWPMRELGLRQGTLPVG
jgi:putative flavoprotein involved in K+ transport